ncbi:MAG: hypothetical protein AAB669_01820 [Patescibacteria group bacterium]
MKKFTPVQEELALQLFDIGAVKFGAFELKLHETQPDAPLSPIYFNLRTPDNPKPGPLIPAVMELIGRVMYGEESRVRLGASYEYIAGIPNAGDPFARAFCEASPWGIRRDQLRYFEKAHDGEMRQIGQLIGVVRSGCDVLLIDDLLTKADTKLEAMQSVRATGAKVYGVLVLIDREQGGKKQLEKAWCPSHAIYKLSDLLDLYYDRGRISLATADEILDYIKANS